METRLIVFARYPEAGQVKTRLIPALGADGAAAYYRRMAEQTLATAQGLPHEERPILQVLYSGGDENAMRSWLGEEIIYHPQAAGDLGCRMAVAFSEVFAEGVERVVLVGTDCPGLSEEILHQAFDGLKKVDVVLGPAEDGGYYLIGMAVEEHRLFTGVSWGTELVLEQTRRAIAEAGLSCAFLPCLSDVDRPDDLAAWPELLPVA